VKSSSRSRIAAANLGKRLITMLAARNGLSLLMQCHDAGYVYALDKKINSSLQILL
jgi:hypothetical protein